MALHRRPKRKLWVHCCCSMQVVGTQDPRPRENGCGRPWCCCGRVDVSFWHGLGMQEDGLFLSFASASVGEVSWQRHMTHDNTKGRKGSFLTVCFCTGGFVGWCCPLMDLERFCCPVTRKPHTDNRTNGFFQSR